MLEQNDDSWAEARAAQADSVREALRPRERVCPACGAPQVGARRTCESCGADLSARSARRLPKLRLAFAALALIAVAGIAVPVIGDLRDDAAAERERAEQRQAALEAAEVRRLTEDAKPVRAAGPALAADADPLEHRTALVAEAEELITADARARAAAGRLDGNIRGTECDPFPVTAGRRAAERDPALVAGRYDCVAYTSKFEAPELEGKRRTGLFGYPYWLVVEYERGRMVFCKVTPRAGEGGRSLAVAPVPVPCRDPEGPG